MFLKTCEGRTDRKSAPPKNQNILVSLSIQYICKHSVISAINLTFYRFSRFYGHPHYRVKKYQFGKGWLIPIVRMILCQPLDEIISSGRWLLTCWLKYIVCTIKRKHIDTASYGWHNFTSGWYYAWISRRTGCEREHYHGIFFTKVGLV